MRPRWRRAWSPPRADFGVGILGDVNVVPLSCGKCGAPLTPYAATGPFESIFAEGHVYRQAAERPRSFIVVAGIWIIFGAFGLTGVVLVAVGRDSGFGYVAVGALLIALAVVMIAKTTRNYFTGRKSDENRDA